MALISTIKEFTGAYRREGFNIITLQGKQYLTSGYRFTEERSSQNNSNLSNMGVIQDFSSISFSDDIESGKQDQIIGLDDQGQILMISSTVFDTRDFGIIHSILNSTSSGYTPLTTGYPGIITTTNNNILYTTGQYLGCGYRFKATSATSTSLTVSGETFNTTYGIDDDDWNGKIYNLTKGEAYTNTTASPTDTLNFSTANTTPETDDVFMVFVDDAFDFGTPLEKGNHFASQDIPSTWTRQIKLSNNHYYILNGNYIARIDVSDNDATNATMENNWQQLHRGRQALCFDMNKENILVGTKYRGKYELFLYNEYSFGSLDTIELPNQPSSILAYKSGWLVVAGANLYYTNGHQLKYMATVPDFEDYDSDLQVPPNGLIAKNKDIFINVDSFSDRYSRGVFIYNTKYGWNYIPVSDDDVSCRDNIDLGALTKYGDKIYSGYKLDNGSNNYVLGELNEGASKNKIAFLLHFNQETRITQIGLNLSEIYDQITNSDYNTTNITVNYCNTRRPLHLGNLSIGTSNTTTTVNFPNGEFYNKAIGQKVLFTSGATAGESTYITDISNKGTSSEQWTVSPALSTSPSDNAYILKYNLNKAHSKTIDISDIPQDIRYTVNFIGDILYFEVEMDGDARIDISNIKLYG